MAKKKKRPTRVANPTSQAKFLAAFAETGAVGLSAQIAGVHRSTYWTWMQDPAFTAKLKLAQEAALEVLEVEARRRAVSGVTRLKFHQGQMIVVPCERDDAGAIAVGDGFVRPYTEHEYSDNLLMFLLKANAPGKYRDNAESGEALGVAPLLIPVLVKSREEAQEAIDYEEYKRRTYQGNEN